jgi:DNA-binding MarR family transcriptional regulator
MEKLNQTFFYTLEKTVKAYRQFFQAQLKREGYDITLDQWLVLTMIIEYKDITQGEIAEKVFKDKASVSRIIDLLEINEYVVKGSHPTHGKMVKIDITKKGLHVINALKKDVPKFRNHALKNISETKKKETQAIMQLIISNVIDSKV